MQILSEQIKTASHRHDLKAWLPEKHRACFVDRQGIPWYCLKVKLHRGGVGGKLETEKTYQLTSLNVFPPEF